MKLLTNSTIWNQFGQKAVEGDQNATGALLELYRPALTAIAKKRLPNLLQAHVGISDIVQQTCADACVSIQNVRARSGGQLWGWVLSLMLKNLADMKRRFISCRKRSVLREVAGHGTHDHVSVRNVSPLESLIEQEESKRLLEAIKQLPEVHATVLQWHYHEGQSCEQIAIRVNRSSDAVRMLIRRAEASLVEKFRG